MSTNFTNAQGTGTVVADGFTGPLSGSATLSTLTLGTAVVAAAGSNSQAGSTLITAPLTVVATVSASTRGVRLPAAATGLAYVIANAGTTQMNIYPATGDKVHTGATNVAYDMVKNKAAIFYAQDATNWRVVIGA